MKKEELEKLSWDELNDLLRKRGLVPCVESNDDREIAISILSQLV